MADDTIDLATGLTRDDLRRAALTTCGYATDTEDARYLLEALGLYEDLRYPTPSPAELSLARGARAR